MKINGENQNENYLIPGFLFNEEIVTVSKDYHNSLAIKYLKSPLIACMFVEGKHNC